MITALLVQTTHLTVLNVMVDGALDQMGNASNVLLFPLNAQLAGLLAALIPALPALWAMDLMQLVQPAKNARQFIAVVMNAMEENALTAMLD